MSISPSSTSGVMKSAMVAAAPSLTVGDEVGAPVGKAEDVGPSALPEMDGALVDLRVGALVDLKVGALVDLKVGALVDLLSIDGALVLLLSIDGALVDLGMSSRRRCCDDRMLPLPWTRSRWYSSSSAADAADSAFLYSSRCNSLVSGDVMEDGGAAARCSCFAKTKSYPSMPNWTAITNSSMMRCVLLNRCGGVCRVSSAAAVSAVTGGWWCEVSMACSAVMLLLAYGRYCCNYSSEISPVVNETRITREAREARVTVRSLPRQKTAMPLLR